MNKEKMQKIILGTSNYENALSGNTVSITGDGGNAWGYCGPAYKKLAPRLFTYKAYAEKYDELLKQKDLEEYKKFRKQIEDEYIKSYYETRLKNIEIIELLELLKNNFGEEIILLCHEPINEFCHRRIVADYIELMTGVYIPEITIDENKVVKKLLPIRYKNRLREIIGKEQK